MITVSKVFCNTCRRCHFVMPTILLLFSLFSFSVIKAQNDPRKNPSPVNVQKITVNNKITGGNSNDSLINVKIGYIKPDSTSADIDLAVKYTTSEKNNDPALTGKENKAVIYNEETQQQREASEEEVRKIVEQVIQNPPANFIYFIDGKETTTESIKKLNPAEIKTINFLKNAEAVKRYGEKARSGVIVLTTK